MRLTVIGVLIALAVAVPVFRTVRRWCGQEPARRRWLIPAAMGALAAVVMLAPGVGDLKPPFSESPAGIFVILARVAALGSLGIAALATLVATIVPQRS